METRLPYPGLRPFERTESDIFFGREEQTDELLRRLNDSRFLAVIGPSGCGKSSLVRAGMIAALETGYMAKAGAQWRVAIMRPGSACFRNLAYALLETLPAPGSDLALSAAFLESTLARGPLGLAEAVRETGLPQGENLLIVVDQFEEIFRFRHEREDEADAFVALLLESASQSDLPIYIVITMRSDYIGDCAVFTGLPEALNSSQFLTPRLTRDQRRMAITGPPAVFDAEVEPRLVNRILNEMGPEPDRLPVLQHALMRMWTYAGDTGETQATTPAAEVARSGLPECGGRKVRVLTTHDYEAVGGLSKALSMHANEVLDSLSERQKWIAECMFRRLCQRTRVARDVRRPTAVSEVAAIAEAEISEVIPVADAFRAPEHNFLMPPAGVTLTPNTMLDITHESLIREWDRLNAWATREAESAQKYAFLRDTAALWSQGNAALWCTPNLENALEWQAREHPTAEWARSYGGDFELAMRFLEESRRARAEADAEAEAERARELESARSLAEAQQQRADVQARMNRLLWRLAVVLSVLVVILSAGIAVYYYGWARQYSAQFNGFVNVSGVPRGIGNLDSSKARRRAVSYRITSKGRWGQVLAMMAVDSRGECTPANAVGTYVERAPDDPSAARECEWRFTYDSQGRVVYAMANDRQGNRVWGFAYSPPAPGREKVRDGYYVGPDGYPQRRNTASFVHFVYDDRGLDREVYYRDRAGRAVQGPDRAFGQRRTYDAQGNTTEVVSLGPDGQPMNDAFGNASLRIKNDAIGNPVEGVAYDATGRVTVVKEGWSMRRIRHDDAGNTTEVTYYDDQAKPTTQNAGYHRVTLAYDEAGNTVAVYYWDRAGKPAVVADGYSGFQSSYDEHGRRTEIRFLGPDGNAALSREGYAKLALRYDEQGNEVEWAFFDAQGRPTNSIEGYSKVVFQRDGHGRQISTAYFEAGGAPTRHKDGFARWTAEYDNDGRQTRVRYFGEDGKPTLGKDGYATLSTSYNENGNEIEAQYFGVDSRPVANYSGYATWRGVYDVSGNRTKTEYFDAGGEPVMSNDGYAGFTAEYDYLGNETKVTYWGKTGEPILAAKGAAGWTAEYDSCGRETRRSYFGLDGQPVMQADGYSSHKVAYDRNGNILEQSYFDTLGGPVMMKDGYAKYTRLYDALSHPVEIRYFGVKGEPVLQEGTYALITRKYDSHGNTIEESYFGLKGEPVPRKAGFHTVRFVRDDRNNVVEVTYYDTKENPIARSDGYARLSRQWDRFGNMVAEATYAANGAPAAVVDGCHKHVMKYDTQNRETEDVCIGLDLQPAAVRYNGDLPGGQWGYATVRTSYDARGRKAEVAFFDAKGKPARRFGTGQHRTRYGYDERGNIVEESYFGTDGRPAAFGYNSGERCSRWSAQYDRFGKLIRSVCVPP
jgi:YD repeat-containing protein